MGVFVCDKCECIENTAVGHYWAKSLNLFDNPDVDGKALCSECAPTHYKDGSISRYGKWHDIFPKVKWDGKREVMNRV